MKSGLNAHYTSCLYCTVLCNMSINTTVVWEVVGGALCPNSPNQFTHKIIKKNEKHKISSKVVTHKNENIWGMTEINPKPWASVACLNLQGHDPQNLSVRDRLISKSGILVLDRYDWYCMFCCLIAFPFNSGLITIRYRYCEKVSDIHDCPCVLRQKNKYHV